MITEKEQKVMRPLLLFIIIIFLGVSGYYVYLFYNNYIVHPITEEERGYRDIGFKEKKIKACEGLYEKAMEEELTDQEIESCNEESLKRVTDYRKNYRKHEKDILGTFYVPTKGKTLDEIIEEEKLNIHKELLEEKQQYFKDSHIQDHIPQEETPIQQVEDLNTYIEGWSDQEGIEGKYDRLVKGVQRVKMKGIEREKYVRYDTKSQGQSDLLVEIKSGNETSVFIKEKVQEEYSEKEKIYRIKTREYPLLEGTILRKVVREVEKAVELGKLTEEDRIKIYTKLDTARVDIEGGENQEIIQVDVLVPYFEKEYGNDVETYTFEKQVEILKGKENEKGNNIEEK